MRLLVIGFISLVFLGCSGKQALKGETSWQKKMNADFKDASKSPLKDKDRKNFVELDFFKFDSAYVVKSILKPTPDSDWFDMKTTTDRVSKERVYGIIEFELKGEIYQLNVYQESPDEEGAMPDYLFLPFLDDTNGNGSYAGGRYIDLKIPEGDSIEVDFNKAFNPYCAYNEKYSCPIVPRENYVATRIEAGVKAFKKK
ncbi:DUF1684 domain-containing protein [Winogradskyella sp.]|uniref:DUF1684 domain-containing protein n=1 Tax=Winogradskyella sp. TaxID=1883156 RepID=UPI0025DCFC88|nr:DUF1684 domain-containing protein [Winogradskyella sp.]